MVSPSQVVLQAAYEVRARSALFTPLISAAFLSLGPRTPHTFLQLELLILVARRPAEIVCYNGQRPH